MKDGWIEMARCPRCNQFPRFYPEGRRKLVIFHACMDADNVITSTHLPALPNEEATTKWNELCASMKATTPTP